MKVVFLVPRRDDGGHRDRLWEWCRQRWQNEMPDIPIFEGHHMPGEGPFNRSLAINRAAKLADAGGRWQIGIVIDSDTLIRVSQVRAAIETARRTGKVTWAHRRWRGFSEEATARVINPRKPHDFGPEMDHDDMDLFVERTTPISWSCCTVFPRKVWDAIGGFDDRFMGWGWEDMAVKSLVTGLHGWERVTGDVYHLFHPRSDERIIKGKPATTASREYVTNARLGRRYMVAVIRDYGIGDQPGEERLSREMRERHVANLKRDDTKLRMLAERLHLPNWDDWWPTLEELRDGAETTRQELASPRVTVVVHTGGDHGNWPQRSTYLRQSLASLNRQVSGPIVQRVIYSDWGPEVYEQLQAIAVEHGFYVAGEGRHGYTGSMRRKWHYLRRRAVGSHIFAAEDDFLYLRPVDLTPMLETLNAHPQLLQLALLREPFYPRELGGTGILGWPEDSFSPQGNNGTCWLTHRLFFTANPSLFRRDLVETGWPVGPSSERLFGDVLLRDPGAQFAFWGNGEPWLRHIGETKAATSTTY